MTGKLLIKLPMSVNTFRYLNAEPKILAVFESIIPYRDNGITDVSVSTDQHYHFTNSWTFFLLLRNFFFHLGVGFQRVGTSSSLFLVTIKRDIHMLQLLSKILSFFSVYPGLVFSPFYLSNYSLKPLALLWYRQKFPQRLNRPIVELVPSLISLSILSLSVTKAHGKVNLFVKKFFAPLSRLLMLNCYLQTSPTIFVKN